MTVSGRLRGYTIAITGDFGEERTIPKFKAWIQVHGGQWVPDICAGVTHLICSQQHFEKKVKMVKEAMKINSIRIVSFDWLEDNLQGKSPKPSKNYLMKDRTIAKTNRKKRRVEQVKKGLKAFEKSCADFERDMFSDGYHIYTDPTNFSYDITLCRTKLATNENQRYNVKVVSPRSFRDCACTIMIRPLYDHHKNTTVMALFAPCSRELDSYITIIDCAPFTPPIFHLHGPVTGVRYPFAQRLQLYESHAEPRTYACYTKYSSPGQTQKPELLAPIGSSFELAFGNFKDFFKLRTAKAWDQRLLPLDIHVPPPIEGQPELEIYVYRGPKEGEPRGILVSEDLEVEKDPEAPANRFTPKVNGEL